MKSGDVCICDFGNNKGSVQCGERPCVIIDNNMAVTFSPCVHCVPLTTKINKPFVLHHYLKKSKYSFLDNTSLALCEQYQLIDKSQIKKRIGNVNQEDLIIITELCKKNFPFNYK